MNSRQTSIIQLLGQNDRVDVAELAKSFGVAEMTIRRDLTDLETQGFLFARMAERCHRVARVFCSELSRTILSLPRRKAIGKLAAELVLPGQTIMVDRAPTALEVSLNIPQDAGITVATSSLCVAQALFGSPVDVLLLGGYLSKDFPGLYGPLTEGMIENLHVDILFVGCDGADSTDGLYAVDLHIARFQHVMMGIADRVVVVTESPKFANKSFARYALWNEVHTLVTDPDLSKKDRAHLEEQGIEVLLAQ